MKELTENGLDIGVTCASITLPIRFNDNFANKGNNPVFCTVT